MIEEAGLRVVRIHTHIGSGSDPAVWQHVAALSLEMVREFPDVTTLNLGGGYKIGRMDYEQTTDLREIGAPIREAMEQLAAETFRRIRLEIEPGTWLTANSCSLVSAVQDIVDTGEEGYRFLKLDTGMTEILRPSLYSSQHPIILLPRVDTGLCLPYVAVGHCCESGDLLTPAPDHHECAASARIAGGAARGTCASSRERARIAQRCPRRITTPFPEAAEVLLAGIGRDGPHPQASDAGADVAE